MPKLAKDFEKRATAVLEEAEGLYADGQREEALRRLIEAEARSWEVQARTGEIAFELERWTLAANNLHGAFALASVFFDEEERDLREAKRATAQQQLQTAKRHIATFAVKSEPKGAKLAIDGREVGRTPQWDIFLDPGEHEVTLTKPCFDEATQSVTLTAGQNGEITVPLSRSTTAKK